MEKFSVTNSGEFILKAPLDYEKKILHGFIVHVTDGTHVRIELL